MRVSKATKNALTATSPNDFIFHSDYNTFKILAAGKVTGQTISSTPTTIQVNHGQNPTIPMVYAFIKFPDGFVHLPDAIEPKTSTSTFRYWHVEVDATNIYFLVYENGGNYNVDITYYIFEAPV